MSNAKAVLRKRDFKTIWHRKVWQQELKQTIWHQELKQTIWHQELKADNLAPRVKNRQFGTHTIWHQDNLGPGVKKRTVWQNLLNLFRQRFEIKHFI